MTKKSKSSQSNPKTTFPIPQATKFHALCRNMANEPDSPHYLTWADQAFKMVGKYLQAGQDAVFQEAFDLVDDDATEHEMRSIIEIESGNSHIPLANDEIGISTLFCLPVIMESQGGIRTKHLHLNGPLFDQLVKSFKMSGIVSSDATVVIPGYLYHHTELDMPYSAIARLPKVIAELVYRKPAGGNVGQSGKAIDDIDPDMAAMELYYLVGCYVTEVKNVEKSFGQEAETKEEQDDYMELQTKFGKQVKPIIDELMKAHPEVRNVIVGLPDTFFSALHGGREMFSYIITTLELEHILANANIAHEDAHAHLACYVDQKKGYADIGVSLMSKKGKFIAGMTRPIFSNDSLIDAMESVLSMLENAGINSTSMEHNLVDFEYDEIEDDREFKIPSSVQISGVVDPTIHPMPKTVQ